MLVLMANSREAAVVEGIDTYGVGSLVEAVGILTEQLLVEPIDCHIDEVFSKLSVYEIDFGDVRGEFAKRAMIVAASGGHNA